LKVAERAGCAKEIATEQEKIKESLFMGLLPIQAITARLGDRNSDLTKSLFPGKNTRWANSLLLLLLLLSPD